jgi:hypothetical protein
VDKILENLSSLDWWFTGVFFIVLAGILPRIPRVLSAVPGKLRSWLRHLKRNDLLWVRSIRHDDVLVLHQVVRTYALMIAFVIVCLLFFYGFLASPLAAIAKTLFGKIYIWLFSTPIYILEVAYILQRDRMKLILKYRQHRLLQPNKLFRLATPPARAVQQTSNQISESQSL